MGTLTFPSRAAIVGRGLFTRRGAERVLKAMVSGVNRARTLGLAAEMSFWLFLSLVPLAAVAGLLTARLAQDNHELLGHSLMTSVPPSARGILGDQMKHIAAWGNGVAPIAAVAFLWLASSGVHSVFDAMEVQSETSRPWWKKRLLALATCVGLSVGIAGLALLVGGLERVHGLLGGQPDGIEPVTHGAGAQVVRWILAMALAVGMTAALYRVGICRDARRRMGVLPGAILAVALMALLGWGYAFYITKVGTADVYQAGLAMVGITMMTLWLLSVALLLGVQLNRVLGDAGSRRAQ